MQFNYQKLKFLFTKLPNLTELKVDLLEDGLLLEPIICNLAEMPRPRDFSIMGIREQKDVDQSANEVQNLKLLVRLSCRFWSKSPLPR